MFFAVVYKSLQRLWSDADITELLGFRNKFILAGALKAKNPVRNSKISNHSSLNLVELFVSSNFEISAPRCSTHYTPDGRSDDLDLDQLLVRFTILYPVRKREA
jgi:hypothetical protein